MKSLKFSWDALLVASIVFGGGALVQSLSSAWADEAAEPEGRIVELNSGASTELPQDDENTTVTEPARPAYWIGIQGRNISDAALRTQFQLAEDTGVVVEEVLEDSPAAKAGLRQHDIVLQANGEGVQGMEDLAKLVATDDGKPIELRLIRLGKEETIIVTPEVRPEGIEQSLSGFPGLGQIGDEDAMRQLMRQLPGLQNLPGGMRMFGPGVVLNGQHFDWNSMPDGVAVTVEKSGDGPAKITVKQGDKTWNVVGDDAKSLEQLPEDVRAYVSQFLQGHDPLAAMNFNLRKELEQNIPKQFGQFFNAPVVPPVPGAAAQQDPVLQKMEQLERQLQELQKRLETDEAAEQ